jgi:ferredoxin
MSADRFLATAGVPRVVTALVDAGFRVVGPSTTGGRPEYRTLTSASDLDLDSAMPTLALKAWFLPPTEALFTWSQKHNDVTLTSAAKPSTPAVVFGARPCDAAGLAVLDKVMGWDYRDDLWFARRESTTIVALACDSRGPDCFCDSVGLAPDTTKGADLLLVRRAGGFAVRVVTEKGEALLPHFPEQTVPANVDTSPARPESIGASPAPGPEQLERIKSWLAEHFDDPFWARLGLRCHGCGACSSVCPTCHCFDIVDEADGLLTGTRRRNWDTCQSGKFTIHASGHNPRGDQDSRFRQRILHKFSIYPQRFGEVLCTGCGRCVDACPAGQDLAQILTEIAAL